MEIVTAVPPKTTEEEIQIVRKMAKLPAPQAGEKIEPYLLLVRDDSPVETVYALGLNFQKYWVSPDASLVQNAGRYFSPRLVATPLSETQAKALSDRLKEIQITVPVRRNPNWHPEEKDSEEKEFLPAIKTTADKLASVTKQSEYNPYSIPKMPVNPALEIEEKTDEMNSASFKEELYKEQRKAKKS